MLRPEGLPKQRVNNENKENPADEGEITEEVGKCRKEFMRILRDLHLNFERFPERGRNWEANGRKFLLDSLKNLFAVGHFDNYNDIAGVAVDNVDWKTFDKCMNNCDYIDSLKVADRDYNNVHERRSRSPSPRRRSRDARNHNHNHKDRSRSRSRDRGKNLKSTREQVLF